MVKRTAWTMILLAFLTACATNPAVPVEDGQQPSLAFTTASVTVPAPADVTLDLVLTGADWDTVVSISATIAGQPAPVGDRRVRVVALSPGDREVRAEAVLTDGSRIAATALVTVQARFVAPGTPDVSFGSDGWIEVGNHVRNIAVDALDRLYLIGVENQRIVVDRLLADGSPDPVWAGGGAYEGPSWADVQGWYVRLAEVDNDGNLIIAGYWGYGTRKDIFIIKLLPDGTPAAGFGSDGVVRYADSRQPYVQGAILLSDGHVLLHARLNGTIGTPIPYGLFVFDSSGRLDATRFGDGTRVLQGDTLGLHVLGVRELADGSFHLAGEMLDNSGWAHAVFVARVERNGTLETTWSPTGPHRMDIPKADGLVSGAFVDDATFVGTGRIVDEYRFGTVEATIAYPWPSLKRTASSMSSPDAWDLPTRIVPGPERTYWLIGQRRPTGQQNPVTAFVVQVDADAAFPGFSNTAIPTLQPDDATWSNVHDLASSGNRHLLVVEVREGSDYAISRVLIVRAWS